MLRGHLDEITHSHVAGWAADTCDRDGVVEVSIFVDGRKVAQTECNLFRPDLQAEGFGRGRHGFSYDFPEGLDNSPARKIAVRFARSGALLDGGEVLLSPSGVAPLPVLEEERADEQMRLPAPRSSRELLELLVAADPKYSIYELLRRVDFGCWTVADAYRAVYGSLKSAPHDLADQRVSDPVNSLNDLIMSADFQTSVLRIVLEAFPEKRRLLFVHIPKCAGSDLSRNLGRRYASIDQRISETRWTNGEQLFSQLRDFVIHSRFVGSIFMRGHIELGFYLKNGLPRPQDRIFTVVRDPISMAISQANYVMMRIREDFLSGCVEHDTADWLNQLRMQMPKDISETFIDRVCRATLRNQNIVISNPMCHWLGGGSAEAVLDRLAENHVEITDTVRYQRWLLERWGIASDTRQNESLKFISQADIAADDLAYLNEISSEDAKLYATVRKNLEISGQTWVDGSAQLARFT